MMAVIFEVQPAPGQQDAYLGAAAALRPLLEQIDGFISIERFESLSAPQKAGRERIFDNYRLRVAAVVRDYGMHDRNQAPADSRSVHT